MWADLRSGIVELFVEAQLLGQPRRSRISAPLRPPLGRWPPRKLIPNGKHVCPVCGYSAHTFQQLNSHRHGHVRQLKIAV